MYIWVKCMPITGSHVFIDVTADKNSRMNSEVNKTILTAQIQAVKKHWLVLHTTDE